MENNVASLTLKWAERKLSLKGQVEVVNAYVASIIYHLTCDKTRFQRSSGHSIIRIRSAGLGIAWILMHRHALRLRHLLLLCASSRCCSLQKMATSLATWADMHSNKALVYHRVTHLQLSATGAVWMKCFCSRTLRIACFRMETTTLRSKLQQFYH